MIFGSQRNLLCKGVLLLPYSTPMYTYTPVLYWIAGSTGSFCEEVKFHRGVNTTDWWLIPWANILTVLPRPVYCAVACIKRLMNPTVHTKGFLLEPRSSVRIFQDYALWLQLVVGNNTKRKLIGPESHSDHGIFVLMKQPKRWRLYDTVHCKQKIANDMKLHQCACVSTVQEGAEGHDFCCAR